MKNSISYKSYLKSPYKSVKHSTYFEIYDDLFARYRDKPITFVEIGVLGGGSLFMWRDFFGPKARIIGIDLNPGAKKWEREGFEIFIGSQSDENFWQEFIKKVGPVDVVLDDGGHTYEQQIVTTELLIENIKDHGMLVVEDTHTSYMTGFGDQQFSFIEYVKAYTDRINQRFGKFAKSDSDRRVWSIQTYESIVAFHVNRQASALVSELTVNSGKDDLAVDYRHVDNQAVKSLQGLAKKMSFLKQVPGVRWLGLKVKNQLINRKSKDRLRKYFQS